MSETVRSWRQMVEDADPDYRKESLRPVVYKFSNGREFRQRLNPYDGPYPFILDVSGLDGIETLG